MMNFKNIILVSIISFALYGCSIVMYGWTEELAFNAYYLVKQDKKDFGNRRVKYNMGYHKNSELYYFLKENNKPDLIREYEKATKCDVIELFYLNKDSVFIFEEPKKNSSYSNFTSGRRINEYEKLTYQKLIKE